MNILKPMKGITKGFVKLAKISWPILAAVIALSFFICPSAFAAGTSIADIASNTSASMGNIATLLESDKIQTCFFLRCLGRLISDSAK